MNIEIENDTYFKLKEDNGIIFKAGKVETQQITADELKKINCFSLVPLSEDEIFTFKVIAGDNEIDDRNYEPFNKKALEDLKKMYTGKTVIKDHRNLSDNQVARIYETELIEKESKTKLGENFTSLILKCYMVKTNKNKDLIAEIKAGIKKEVSTGMRAKHIYCSICGLDNIQNYCRHYGGEKYDTDSGKKTCYFILDGAQDAFELSFVAVPAQRRAGTIKQYKYSTEKDGDSKLFEKLKSLEFFIVKEGEKKENE